VCQTAARPRTSGKGIDTLERLAEVKRIVVEVELEWAVLISDDEGVVRAAAQAALDDALGTGAWTQVAERRFEMPVRFRDFADFEQRMMRPTFADHLIDGTKLATTRAAFEPHVGPDGAHFNRPMRLRLLRRMG